MYISHLFLRINLPVLCSQTVNNNLLLIHPASHQLEEEQLNNTAHKADFLFSSHNQIQNQLVQQQII